MPALSLRCCLSLLLVVNAIALPATPQNTSEQQTSSQAAAADAGSGETERQRVDRCWTIILASLQDTKNGDRQAQAMNALSEMPHSARATGLIAQSMTDPKVDVRTAAILAAGKTKAPALLEPLRKLLDDPEPQVAFAAAATLWKQFGDSSSADILQAVMEGDRRTGPTLMRSARHDMSHTMHSPSALARIGLNTGAGLLLGPFGYAVTGAEYVHAKGGTAARVQAIELLSERRTPALADELISALGDKEEAVRAAAVHHLGQYGSPTYAPAIAPLLDDSRLPVRLSAAAAYINSVERSKPAPPVHRRRPR